MSRGIRGIGVDVVENARIERALRRWDQRFLHRILTPGERMDVGDPPYAPSVAVRFAAKEAVAKAFGTGLRGLSWQEIEVRHDALGAPHIHLYGAAAKRAEQMGVRKAWVALSHERSVSVAMVVLEG